MCRPFDIENLWFIAKLMKVEGQSVEKKKKYEHENISEKYLKFQLPTHALLYFMFARSDAPPNGSVPYFSFLSFTF